MLITETAIDVRYPDMDTMGIVHHGVYPIWYEIARMDFFDKAGLPFAHMSQYDIHPVMVNLNLNYGAPVRYPERVTIRTYVRSYAPKKLELGYEVTVPGRGEPVASATSFHIWAGGPDLKSYNIEENLPEIYARITQAAT